jgi:signal transduction histidine kinase
MAIRNIGLTFFILCVTRIVSYSQQTIVDSLKHIVSLHENDTNEVKALSALYEITNYSNLDSAIGFAQKGLLLAKSLQYENGEASCYLQLSNGYSHRGSFSQAIHFAFKALAIYNRLQNKDGIATAHLNFEVIYNAARDYRSSLLHSFILKQIVESGGISDTASWSTQGMRWRPLIYAEIGRTYETINEVDSALIYARQAINENQQINGAKWNFPFYVLGRILMKQGKYSDALTTFHTAIPMAIANGYPKDTLDIYNSIASLYKATGNLDSAIYYAKSIIDKQEHISHVEILFLAATTLSQTYKLKGNIDSTLKFIEFSNALRDSIYSQEKQRDFQNITFNELLRQQELQQQEFQSKNKIRVYILIFSLVSFAVIAAILYRANFNKKRANNLLQEQKKEIEQQKNKVESTLQELKATQAQLIQSEKMAFLGELTAGIAHEIQNPLNFVNNFSETNLELIQELKQELDTVNVQEAKQIASNVEENEQKINHHGRRAETIVKNMLAHSRSSKGERQPTDLNILVDEYIRLAYHGFRAKDKGFNATIQTHFDPDIGKVNIMPQEIARVLLNLFNNAFYAMYEKMKKLDEGYEPQVTVNTKRKDDKIEIKVADNGMGISKGLQDKIFQPFFTTKPAGQGTGLGLSLSYEIINAHGGNISVESKEGEGSVFTITIPKT